MFFYVPGMSILAIYVLAAVLPAVFLMRYVYRKDTVEKEPPALLASLALMGVFAALAAMVLERIGGSILNRLVSPSSRWYVILLAFLVVGAAEEGCKLFFLKRRSWWDPNFNYRFDGVVYAVFVSLGFAAFENVLYVFRYGLSVVLPRALLQKLPRGAVIIDLASLPGGTDFAAAEALGLHAEHALALPGRCAPQTAGALIAQTVLTILEERGEYAERSTP